MTTEHCWPLSTAMGRGNLTISVQPPKLNDGARRLNHHWVSPPLHHLVWCFHHRAQGKTAVYNLLRWGGDWQQSAILPGPVHLQGPERCREDWPTPPTQDKPSWNIPLRWEAALHQDTNPTSQIVSYQRGENKARHNNGGSFLKWTLQCYINVKPQCIPWTDISKLFFAPFFTF